MRKSRKSARAEKATAPVTAVPPAPASAVPEPVTAAPAAPVAAVTEPATVAPAAPATAVTKPATAIAPAMPAAQVEARPKPRIHRQGAPNLSVSFCGIRFKNPVIAASGTFGYGIEFEDIVNLDKLGGFVVKGLSREPMPGNPPPRLYETAAGMLNAVGLQNIGARAFVEEKLPLLRKIKDIVVITNVFGHSVKDYEETIRILNDAEGIAAYELNVSCPNTKQGGIAFGSDPVLLEEVVAAAKSAARRPLIVKLSPNVTNIAQMARAAENAGADALSLVNTFVAMAIDPETRRPRISNVTAGLSGPAIKPIALRMVYEAAHAVDIPVIGLGGISSATDVIEFMLAGAAAVEVGTANFWDPCATEKIIDGLEGWCVEHRIDRIVELVGGMKTD